jgi:hypothetical protein
MGCEGNGIGMRTRNPETEVVEKEWENEITRGERTRATRQNIGKGSINPKHELPSV